VYVDLIFLSGVYSDFHDQVTAIHLGPKVLTDSLRPHQLGCHGQRFVENGDGVTGMIDSGADASSCAVQRDQEAQRKSGERKGPHKFVRDVAIVSLISCS